MAKSFPLRTIGKITSPHGLKGEISLKPCDEEAAWIGKLKKVYIFKNRGPVETKIESARLQGNTVILKFENVSTREEAELIKGFEVKALEAELPAPGENEFYTDELVGFSVISQDSGKTLGSVEDVLSSSAGDFLEVYAENLSEPVLVPFLNVFIPRVDRDSCTLFITGLDSLFLEQ